MDARNNRSHGRRSAGRRSSKHQDAYVVHILALDGTIATINKKPADGTFQLTVEAGDRRLTRKLPPTAARDPESAEITQVVAEMKAELAARGDRSAH